LLECAIALALLSVLATSIATSGRSELRYFARSMEETVAERVASSRIERLSASTMPLIDGERSFDVDPETLRRLPDAAARESVTRLGPRLVRVEADVTWRAADGGTAHARLATLLAR